MRNMGFMAIICSALMLTACNQNDKPAATTETKAADTKGGTNIKLSQLASNKDYNCGMTLEEGAVADTASYNGKTYGFCSPECKADFLKNPQALLDKK